MVTGPVLTNGLKTIGQNRVSVPEWYYKVILDNHEPGINGIAFLIPNASQTDHLQSFVVSIDSVESVTGIDFFPNFPHADQIEKTVSIEHWSWTTTSHTEQVTQINQESKDTEHSPTSQQDQPGSLKVGVSVQCHGVTKSGNRCQNKTMNANGYCHLHQSQP